MLEELFQLIAKELTDCSDLTDDNQKLLSLVIEAVIKVYDNDEYLIRYRTTDRCNSGEYHVAERSVVFRFAHYLQCLIDQEGTFSQLNLDCEYNRNKQDLKRISQNKNGVMPDVILHSRGNNDYNTLVIEVKGYWNKNRSNDYRKLKAFTYQNEDYKYSMGLSLMFGKEKSDVKIAVFKHGKLITTLNFKSIIFKQPAP